MAGSGNQILPVRLLLPFQQVADKLVGQQEAFWGEMPTPVGLLRPALSAELLQPGLERSEVHEIGAAVLLLVDALHGAQRSIRYSPHRSRLGMISDSSMISPPWSTP